MIEVVTVELAWKMKWDYLIITNLLGLCFNLFVVFASYSWYKHHFGAIGHVVHIIQHGTSVPAQRYLQRNYFHTACL